jgi:hypothetical protein
MSRRPNSRGSRFNADDCKEKACTQEGRQKADDSSQGCGEKAGAQDREKDSSQDQEENIEAESSQKSDAEADSQSEKTGQAAYGEKSRRPSSADDVGRSSGDLGKGRGFSLESRGLPARKISFMISEFAAED